MQHTQENVQLATFAGGCFWCLEADFAKQPGVLRAVSGYAGGHIPDPTYAEVCTGETGHLEAVQVSYDPHRTTYADLLDAFWRHIDPTDPGGQFVDRGSQYRTAVFYHDDEQHRIAEESKAALVRSDRFNRPIVTEIRPFSGFHAAEDYHQQYHRTQSLHYRQYRAASGRDRFLDHVWTNAGTNVCAPPPDDAALRERLTPLQYAVTRQCGTEPPFRNAYWDEKRAGIYVDIVTGEPLFSSRDKFDSGTGWPSFRQPLEPENIRERTDLSHGMERTEVRSRRGGNHLGHVFPDGPAPTGLRYCINSVSLRFIPQEDMEKEGYGEYLKKLNPPDPP